MQFSPPPGSVISVIGGGWSFNEVDHNLVPGFVIAINDSGLRLNRKVDLVLTMDRLWTEGRWEQLLSRQIPFWARINALKNIRHWNQQPWVRSFECNEKSLQFTENVDVLNGTSSGMCGMNAAYIQRPRELYLFGFDMCKGPNGQSYWYPHYPWAPNGGTTTGKYAAWSKQFDAAAKAFAQIGCKVFNVSSASKITAFDRYTPKQMRMRKAA